MSDFVAGEETQRAIRKLTREYNRAMQGAASIQAKVNALILDEMDRLDVPANWSYDPATGKFEAPPKKVGQ